MLNSVIGSMEIFFLYLVLVAVLFGRYRDQFPMVHTATAKATFVAFGITMFAAVIGVFSDFEAVTTMQIAILGNVFSLWVHMVKHLIWAVNAGKPHVKVTEEEEDPMSIYSGDGSVI